MQSKIVKYAGTAGVAAIVDVGLFWGLSELAMPSVIAAAVSFLIASVVNYFLTARYVFHAPIGLANYGLFLSGASLGFAINVGVTLYCSTIVGLPAPLAKLAGVGVAFFANFALNSVFVFRKSSSCHRPVP
ncbi:MAG: GtrA family protein [Alphaproteobacteria bacterium]